ncbi:MAG: protein-ADP-ribose hydrolase [Treponema sp.]|nr:protein-ADP-ribose hydrolase [Treponema sp.]
MSNRPQTQADRRRFLIAYLLAERPEWKDTPIPEREDEQRTLLRSLMNVRNPLPASEEFLRIQDEYLREVNKSHGITDIADLPRIGDGLYLWRGDITTLRVGAIVNAANSGMTGCWQPCHACIDNCIHTFAGIQLRSVCAQIMQKQGHEEPTGDAKITPAFNLPCDYVLHTVGPIISGPLTQSDCDLLSSCYKSCLDRAAENGVESVAFCCISTGVFRFPADRAAEIAVATVKEWRRAHKSTIKVVFNVFSEKDESIYKRVLGIVD